MRITSSRFERAAYRRDEEPLAPGPVVVFLGRSNVGKSSLINRLLGVRGLARTSAQPGKTQAIHFYRVNESYYFVDLPGYGYARVPEAVRRAWRPLIEGFLDRWRERIALALVVVDSGVDPTELDRTMQAWLVSAHVPYLIAATKSDRLSGNGRTRARAILTEAFGPTGAGERPILVSGRTGVGLAELQRHLAPALAAARRRSGLGLRPGSCHGHP